jgi:acetyltransferase-like isoleucine patch superfamily enzyme|tara:strand:- start:790 stop:1014 length:225 start_codon:yes stop_codon:yes gene_type:complete
MRILIILAKFFLEKYRKFKLKYIKKQLDFLGERSSISDGVVISFPENVFIQEDVSIAYGVHIAALSNGQVTFKG